MIKKALSITTLVLILVSCNNNKKMNLQSGDIVFCSYQTGELSGAIDEVTQTDKATHYSHMGLVEIIQKDTFIIHASLKRGVVKESLGQFLKIDQPLVVDVYRLKDTLMHTIPKALKQVNTLVGLPYNAYYKMNDSSYYCSQLIFEVFKVYNVFSLEPMTFKNPGSDEFNPGWINYYSTLGIEIPEGEPGCNPNGLAASNNLRFVTKLK